MKTILKTMDRLVVALNTKCFTDSFSQSEFLLEQGISNRGSKLEVLGYGSLSGVKHEKFAPQNYQEFKRSFYEKFHIQSDEFLFLFLGRKSKDKGVFDLIQAFKEIDKTHFKSRLILVGPEEEISYEIQIQEINSRYDRSVVIDIPKVNDPERYFSLAHALCIFSYREGFGTVAIEAAAASMPVLGTSIPGLVDSVVHGETGILVPVGSIESIRKSMIQLARSPDTARAMGVAGYQMVLEKYTASKVYSYLAQFYRRYMK